MQGPYRTLAVELAATLLQHKQLLVPQAAAAAAAFVPVKPKSAEKKPVAPKLKESKDAKEGEGKEAKAEDGPAAAAARMSLGEDGEASAGEESDEDDDGGDDDEKKSSRKKGGKKGQGKPARKTAAQLRAEKERAEADAKIVSGNHCKTLLAILLKRVSDKVLLPSHPPFICPSWF